MKKNIAEVVNISNNVYEKGLVSGKAGNISTRHKSECGDIISITPTLKSLGDLKEEDIVLASAIGTGGESLFAGTDSSFSIPYRSYSSFSLASTSSVAR